MSDSRRKTITVAITTMLLALVTSCAHPQAVSEAEIDGLVAKNDTVALAHLADKACAGISGEKKMSCWQDYFVKLARSDRVHIALGALSSLGAEHPEVTRDGHMFTHIIGIRAYHEGADVRSIFRSCTGLFQSGCYHGVIQAYLTEGGHLDSARAVKLCDVIAADEADRWLRFQCVHGEGHGFDMVANWDLPTALTHCNWLRTAWDRESCYGGAFMENAVASAPGGHHVAMHAIDASTDSSVGHDSAMAGMNGMADMPMPDPTKITYKMRDSADALYPCSSLDSLYEFACYQLQGGLILEREHNDFGKAAADCDKAPPIGRSQCYVSLGTNASGMTVQNTPKVIDDCSHGDPGYQPFCFIGAVKNYIDVTAKADDGLNFCKEVPPGANRMQCYSAVGEELSVLFSVDTASRAKACNNAPIENVGDCRRGAGLAYKPM